MKRPELEVGDIVKYSKKVPRCKSLTDIVMVVVDVNNGGIKQDTTDRSSIITVIKYWPNAIILAHVRRGKLWKTGYNVFDAGKTFEAFKDGRVGIAAQNRALNAIFVNKNAFNTFVSVPKVNSILIRAEDNKIETNENNKPGTLICPRCKRNADIGLPCWSCGKQN